MNAGRIANKKRKKVLDTLANKRRILDWSYEVGYVPSSHQSGAGCTQLASPRFTPYSKSLS